MTNDTIRAIKVEKTLLGPTGIQTQYTLGTVNDMLPTKSVPQTVDYWTSKPKDVGSNPNQVDDRREIANERL